MIKRKSFFTAAICVLVALVSAFAVFFTGCAEYTPPQNGGDTPTPTPTPDPDPDPDPGDGENAFTVQLVVKSGDSWINFSEEFYDASDGNGGSHASGWTYWEDIKVQWTDRETNARYTASLDGDGKATRTDLDGDYKVTLTALPTGFTYEPNQNYVDNITRSVEIIIYQLYSIGDISTRQMKLDATTWVNYYTLTSSGAYRIVLNSVTDNPIFCYRAPRQGTYSLRTLADVTANLVNPKLTVYKGNLAGGAIYHFDDKDDGGAANTYTKNIYWEYTLSSQEAGGDNALIFSLYSTSVDGTSGYPITIDFLIQRDGDYSKSYSSTNVSVTEDFTKTPETPAGTFTFAAYRGGTSNGLMLDQSMVILNTEAGMSSILNEGNTVLMGEQATLHDGYYYYYTYDGDKTYTLTDRVYAAFNINNEVYESYGSDFLDSRVSFRYIEGYDGTYYNYTNFVSTYRSNCNGDGVYPVNEEVALFFQLQAISQRFFNDGNGQAETGAGYTSDEDSMWMYVCGWYE